ncbi:hypothetical protein [Polluticaenibacter yanchengensis]|uniref:KilA-N domain-containing protein n=1 Tax=Polluticaenibacter yanchengensis TaxID=3014562 RepID=A0ABT4UMG2_9BACT|nr:hypothetical protein [Chitinophagaceae bacterium LY-5]
MYVVNVPNNKPTIITMELGTQEIFLNATGQISVLEMMKIAQQMYVDSKMQIPDALHRIINR